MNIGGSGRINVSKGDYITVTRNNTSNYKTDTTIDLYELSQEIKYIIDRFHHYETIFNFIVRESLLEEKYPELKTKGREYENYVKEIFANHFPKMDKLKKEYSDLINQCNTLEKLKKNI